MDCNVWFTVKLVFICSIPVFVDQFVRLGALCYKRHAQQGTILSSTCAEMESLKSPNISFSAKSIKINTDEK